MSKLLIAEDEVFIRYMLRSIVDWAELGFDEILEADNGGTALEILRCKKPELTLIDIRMPIMDGLQVAKLAEDEGLTGSFIIITGFAEFSYACEAVRNPRIVDYLLKPVDEKVLREIAERFVAKTESGPEAEENNDQNWMGCVTQYIESNICTNNSLVDIAKRFNVNASYLSSCLKRKYGVPYTEYIIRQRMEIVQHLLLETNMPVGECAKEVGYSDVIYFHKIFKRQFGMPPGEYRKKHRKWKS